MFQLIFTDDALADLQQLTKREQSLLLDTAERQLRIEPTRITRNRKPLRPNVVSEWAIRAGRYRIFYDVDQDATAVLVKAFGIKRHNRLFIRGREYRL